MGGWWGGGDGRTRTFTKHEETREFDKSPTAASLGPGGRVEYSAVGTFFFFCVEEKLLPVVVALATALL